MNGIEVDGLALCKLILISVESLAAKIHAVAKMEREIFQELYSKIVVDIMFFCFPCHFFLSLTISFDLKAKLIPTTDLTPSISAFMRIFFCNAMFQIKILQH